jgi:small GTP-binding protein
MIRVHGPHGWLGTISLTRLLTGRWLRSDWTAVERERGTPVSSAVMSFEHEALAFNLLDTPGDQDFSEDIYRTLTAVDSAVMVLDAAPHGAKRGIEEQTRKLFEVCRLRDVPIMTFVNKLDREGLDPFDLLDEIEQALALDVTPASWPIGMGRNFLGTHDLFADALYCSSAASTTRSSSRSAAMASTTRNCRGRCRKKRSPNCARRSRWPSAASHSQGWAPLGAQCRV